MPGGASGVDDRDTIEPPAATVAREQRVPGLTILHHPDPSRVGARVRLLELAIRKPVPLSRHEPRFAQPGGGGGEPRGLDDPCISRRPVHLMSEPGSDGITIDPGGGLLAVDGEPIERPRRVSPRELARGVVLELAQRVVLLLHQLGRDEPPRTGDLGLVGDNQAIAELRRAIRQVAGLDVAVLIRGETGTGKELVARAVHEASHRAGAPFVTVNVAAIPPATAASELFGHTRGAFTGAATAHEGYFARAEGGTLFLDEIGATPTDVQPMLLRALESLEIQPLGSGTPRRVDVRIVAATDADLEHAIAEGSFRAAVYHRLEGYQLFVPPLRERRDDLGRLLVYFLERELAGAGYPGRLAPPADGAPPWLPSSFVAQLAGLSWPGNVRQLRNVARQVAISSADLPTIGVDAALTRLLEGARAPQTAPTPAPPAAPPAAPAPTPTPPPRLPGELSDRAILQALREHHFNVPSAAGALGVSRSALYERMRTAGIRQAKDLVRDELMAAREACGGDVAAMARHLDVSARALAQRLKELELVP